MAFHPFDLDSLYQPKNPADLRLSHYWQHKEGSQGSYCITGYPDDEGIELNGGRLGASQAPDQIRNILSRMTLPRGATPKPLVDLGNLDAKAMQLSEKHKLALEKAKQNYSKGYKCISLGGGHDYGFPDAGAFLEFFQSTQKLKPIVINFDAHLDVRPTDNGFSSGTPFYRLLESYSDFDFLEIGIQPFCNSPQHFDWAEEKGAHLFTLNEIQNCGLSIHEEIIKFLAPFCLKQRPCFLSVDIDVFSSSFAQGCSQSWPSGLTPWDFYPCFHFLKQRLDLKGLGIYEVSPPLDLDNRTSKLAAEIIYNYLF